MNKLKKFYPPEKIFIYILLGIIIMKPLSSFGVLLALIIFNLLLNKFEDTIRREYGETLHEYFERIIKGEDLE